MTKRKTLSRTKVWVGQKQMCASIFECINSLTDLGNNGEKVF